MRSAISSHGRTIAARIFERLRVLPANNLKTGPLCSSSHKRHRLISQFPGGSLQFNGVNKFTRQTNKQVLPVCMAL